MSLSRQSWFCAVTCPRFVFWVEVFIPLQGKNGTKSPSGSARPCTDTHKPCAHLHPGDLGCFLVEPGTGASCRAGTRGWGPWGGRWAGQVSPALGPSVQAEARGLPGITNSRRPFWCSQAHPRLGGDTDPRHIHVAVQEVQLGFQRQDQAGERRTPSEMLASLPAGSPAVRGGAGRPAGLCRALGEGCRAGLTGPAGRCRGRLCPTPSPCRGPPQSAGAAACVPSPLGGSRLQRKRDAVPGGLGQPLGRLGVSVITQSKWRSPHDVCTSRSIKVIGFRATPDSLKISDLLCTLKMSPANNVGLSVDTTKLLLHLSFLRKDPGGILHAVQGHLEGQGGPGPGSPLSSQRPSQRANQASEGSLLISFVILFESVSAQGVHGGGWLPTGSLEGPHGPRESSHLVLGAG